jgi:tetratricopeptide (TPR) repeat protein
MMAEDNIAEHIDPNADQRPDAVISPLVPSAKEDREEAVRELTAKMLTYNSFVGKQSSSFNDLMAQGERLLKDRQYYYAARTYRRASELRPENPLAQLGRAYSLTGAGDLISAARNLAQALDLFPEQAKRKIDLQGFFHSPEELQRITTKLENMANAGTNNAHVRLLLGYIYHYSGQSEMAVGVLNEAAEQAKAGEKIPAELTNTIEKFAQAVAKQAGK